MWIKIQEIIRKTCDKYDKKWQRRRRVLNSSILVTFILKIVGSKNNQGYGSNLVELWENFNNQGVKLPQDNAVSASSICEARQKLSEDIFLELNKKIVKYWNKTVRIAKFKGYRIFGVDGSRITLPRELANEGFKVYDEKRGRYYPQGIMSCLYNLQEKVIYDIKLEKHMNERLCALEHMKKLVEDDIVIFDRGYFSYLLFCKAVESKGEAIFRIQSNGGNNKKIRSFVKNKAKDKIIEYTPSTTVKHDLKKAGYNLDFKPITMRLVKEEVGKEIYVFATTILSRKNFPTEYFSEIYQGRWGIEELYKISKRFIEIEDFHSKTERGIRQELYAHILLINLSRLFEYEAQKTNNPKGDSGIKDESRVNLSSIFNPLSLIKINFKNCLQVVSRNISSLLLKSLISLDEWLQKIINSIARIKQKIRPRRHYPRISRKPYSKWSKNGKNNLYV